MSMLNRRLQVLIDEDLEGRLRRAAQSSGASVGELVRRALDREFPAGGEPLGRAEAAARILAWEPPPGHEPDWAEQKERMLDELYGATSPR